MPKLGWIVLIALGCSSQASPKATVEAMRRAACAGDADGYFASVDRTAVARALGEEMVASLPAGLGQTLSPPAVQLLVSSMDAIIRDTAATYSARLDAAILDDVKRGSEGHVCRMRVGDEQVAGNDAHVRITEADGIRRDWKMHLFAKRWVVIAVEVIDEDREIAGHREWAPDGVVPPPTPRVPKEVMEKVVQTELAYRAAHADTRSGQ